MIYSPQFDALPDWVRSKIYAHLKREASPEALEILRDTKHDLAF